MMDFSFAFMSELFFIFFMTAVSFFGVHLLLKFLSASSQEWRDLLAQAVRWPLICFILVQAAFNFFGLMAIDQLFITRLVQVRVVFLVGILAWFLLRAKFMFEKLVERYFTAQCSDKIFITAADKLITLGIVVFALFMILDAFGISLTALFAFGGISGIAVSLAAKDVVANFFGGLMIYINRPFVIGDWIRSSNKEFEGVVEDIGWYMTSIKTPGSRPLYVPNALITNAILENCGKSYNRSLRATIGICYQDIAFIERIVGTIDLFLRGHSDIDQAQKINVSLVNLADYALEVEFSAFIKTTDSTKFYRIKQDVLLNIAQIVKTHGASIAFPAMLIQSKQGQSL
ncbi:mechanosensitive ion channel family protein [Candidatus Babeliales bacterium]|nr:mechanosensitive ion channel family protein [Candidatus Babeliales bacterium]